MTEKNQATQHDSQNTDAQKTPNALREERILSFWNKEQIFQKSLDKESPSGEFIFYDGPPFATGSPHYGHILASTIKDVIPRYKTMRGFHVPRRWGWDCHGLPIENMVEKELGLKSKKDIEDYGLEQFTEVARNFVVKYADVWREQVPRFGRWVDMENDYRTMDSSYTESVWWVFKTLYKKGLIYEGFKSMQLCPRCGTTLSNFEVNQGYKDITDISVYAKFELVDEPNTFFLAWTTTPWTLPGNVALAVNPKIEYVKIKIGDAHYIVAKERLSVIKEEHTVVEEHKGSKYVGHAYKPVFEYYKNLPEAQGKAWKVYGADFVTTTDGTGIVHIAPAFGSDDYELAQKHKLPLIQHVSADGKFKAEVTDFAGQYVKPKGEPGEKDPHQKGDIEIIKYLAHKNLLFAKEKIVHSYPHCWRCDTPLLNYAASSWFVDVTSFKDSLVEENSKINWVPKEVGQYRFGNWLEGARDWAISRARYWGAPLPVWKSEDGKEVMVVGTKDHLKTLLKPRNKYIVMRHGEAESNVQYVMSTIVTNPHKLTSLGINQVEETARKLKKEKIDVILSSPFVRTRESAEIVAKAVGHDVSKIIFDDRLGEISAGSYEGKNIDEYLRHCPEGVLRFAEAPEGGETLTQVRRRMMEALYDIDMKHEGKTILIVTHQTPAWLMFAGAEGLTKRETIDYRTGDVFIRNGDVRPMRFVHLPHNDHYEIDFHRPYIDEVVLYDKHNRPMRRVKDVFDCWFESGSMPYGEAQYKGEPVPHFDPMNNEEVGYPADFIAEGLDQTRGWFYSMLVLGVALFGKSPFKNVIVNGLVLAEDGKKMSKSLKNYPDPMTVVNKFGMDSVRYFMLQSPVVASEDLCFAEKGVDEISKKIVNRLDNVVAFYEMYKDSKGAQDGQSSASVSNVANPKSSHVLDQWIVARLDQTLELVTKGLEGYELNVACRPINDFIEDLSVWYIRRSRDRFKSQDAADAARALQTTRYVLERLSRMMAPFMPFFAEDVYQRVKGTADLESVHLQSWPHADENVNNPEIVKLMENVRSVVTIGLEARAKAGIKVRQPLASLTVKGTGLANHPDLLELIKDEVNVKKVFVEESIEEPVVLDTQLTDELKDEGAMRELLRAVQDLRKEKGLSVGDMVDLEVQTDEKGSVLVKKFETAIKQAAQFKSVTVSVAAGGTKESKPTMIDGMPFAFTIKK